VLVAKSEALLLREKLLESNIMKKLIDPTSELKSPKRVPLKRLADLQKKTVGLLDISKPKGDIFLDRIAVGLNERGVRVKRFSKPTFTRLAPIQLKNEIVGSCDAVIEALAD